MKTYFALLCFLINQMAYAQLKTSYQNRHVIYQDLLSSNLSSKSPLNDLLINGTSVSGKKNVGLAVIYSLLLPGMGEFYVGEYGIGKYFTITEAALWLTFTSFDMYGNWLRDDARKFAVSHAGIDPSGKDDQFFVDVGNFLNTYEYDEKKLRDRAVDKLYDINSTYFWRWDSDPNRASYHDMRISHDRVFNNARFVIAVIVVNHIASAVNAARLAVSHNKRTAEAFLFDIRAHLIGGLAQPDGIMISLSKNF